MASPLNTPRPTLLALALTAVMIAPLAHADAPLAADARTLDTVLQLEPRHHAAGVRAYYSGVKDLDPQGFIDLIDCQLANAVDFNSFPIR